MDINQAGLDLIKRFEGLRLKAYQDVAGIWTIGYGHIKNVTAGMTITAEEAERLLRDDLRDAEKAVESAVKSAINDNQFSALVSLVFNIGRGAFAKSSTLKFLNKDDVLGAADAIELWNKATVGGKKVVVSGLAARRAAEKGLFLTPTLASLAASAAAPAPAPKADKAPPPKATGAAATAKPKVTADTGPESRAKPTVESSRTRRENLGGSRTIQGAVATAATGAATAGTGATAQKHIDNPQVQQVLSYVHTHGNEILILMGILLVMASLWIIAARIDDWSKGYR